MLVLTSTARSCTRHASRMMSGRAFHPCRTFAAGLRSSIHFSVCAEERSLKGDFSGWHCNNGIIYSKHPRPMCVDLDSASLGCSRSGLVCCVVLCTCLYPCLVSVSLPESLSFQLPPPDRDLQTVLALWQQPTAPIARPQTWLDKQVYCSTSVAQSHTVSSAVSVLTTVLNECMICRQCSRCGSDQRQLWRGPLGSGWAAITATPAVALALRLLLTQASIMMLLQLPTLKHVCTCLAQAHTISSVPKIAGGQDQSVIGPM